MKKIILALLIPCMFNISALAVDVSTGKTEDPKKADEALVVKDKTKKLTVDERRKELKRKHAAKKSAKAAALAAATPVSGDASTANSKVADPTKDVMRETKIQENKEDKASRK